MLRVFVAFAVVLLGSCQSADGAKYPQGLKEVRPDVYSRSLADAITMRTLSDLSGRDFLDASLPDLSGRDFLDSSLLSARSPLPPGAPLCTGPDLSAWRNDPNRCVVVALVASERCLNRDGCAQLQLSEALSSPSQLAKVLQTLEQPCAYFPDQRIPNYRLVEFWNLAGLHNQIGDSSGRLGCMFRKLRPAVRSYDPTTRIVTLAF